MIQITFATNDDFKVNAQENSNLLRVSIRERGGIPFKCGGGICGTCKCHIVEGLENTDELKAKELKHLTPEEIDQGFRMACQTFVSGNITVEW